MADNDQPSWGSFAGSGLQIAVGVGLGFLIGRWLDRRFDWHWGAIIGAMVGLASGLYLLIKDAMRMNKD
jgi:F0F1-type ATP synthase assembly protein I